MEQNYEIEDINEAGDQVIIRFAPDRSVVNLPNMRMDGKPFLPYIGSRFINHPRPGYYVAYVPADCRAIQSLGRMGGIGNGQIIEIDSAAWINPGEQFDAPGQGSVSQWRQA